MSTKTATLIGYNKRGIVGAVACIAGVITPSIIIIMCIATFISAFTNNMYMAHAFSGIRVAVTVLVGHAVYKMGQKALIDNYSIGIFVVALLAALFTNISSILIIVIACIAGVAIAKFRENLKGGQQ